MRQERELELNKLPESRGEHVLYWMRSAVRSDSNLCLDWAIDRSNELKLPLLVLFCLVGDYPGASPVHYEYLRKGLAETEAGLQAKGIRFIVAKGKPETLVPRLASRSVLLVCEGAYLAYQRNSLVELVKNLDRRAVLMSGSASLTVSFR
ncbi:hypothetical protein MASR2M78_32750 [Treponema sp.]